MSDFNRPDYEDVARKELVDRVPARAITILDVGCNYGAFGYALKQVRTCEVWGVEPDKAAAEHARQRLDHVIQDTFNTSNPLPNAHFDLVTFNDSLEHMTDPAAALLLCQQILKPGGLIQCCVPNIRHIKNLEHLLIDKDWRYEQYGVRDRTHLRFFTQKSIVELFQSCGFMVTDVKGFNEDSWGGDKPLRRLVRKLVLKLLPSFTQDMKFMQIVLDAQWNPVSHTGKASSQSQGVQP